MVDDNPRSPKMAAYRGRVESFARNRIGVMLWKQRDRGETRFGRRMDTVTKSRPGGRPRTKHPALRQRTDTSRYEAMRSRRMEELRAF